MAADPIAAARAYVQAARAASEAAGGVAGADQIDFGALVQNAVKEAQTNLQAAETQAVNVAAGRGDIVDVVTAIAAAETQMETVMAVRDQVIQAYQEILRMPI
ncbi:MAG: flagellar hook-basal body complex protein FliE [Alphaproteobacteria bacterium]|nr:flagellar hook-basal body complex protein FliE [Alphaproteobacteria bacterium]